MSGGWGCRCTGTTAEKRANWRVVTRKANHSAFSGYRRTPSQYSQIICIRCNALWRTKAKYVDELADHKICGTKSP